VPPGEEAKVKTLYARVRELQIIPGREVDGIDIIRTFLERRIQPLQARAHPMWIYTGQSDPTRSQEENLSSAELGRQNL
jgi:hypothetical protein